MRVENDPDLKMQQKIIDHHPHHGFPQHGKIMRAPAHMMEKIKAPKQGRDKHGRWK